MIEDSDRTAAEEYIKKRDFILEFMHMNIGDSPTVLEVEIWAMGLSVAGFEVMLKLRDMEPDLKDIVQRFFKTHQNLVVDILETMEKNDK